METIVKMEHITKKYGEREILKDVSLTINKEDFITIVGTSGSGKTTLLKMINGLITPTSGNIYLHDQKLEDLDILKTRRKIGYAVQGNGLFPHMTVEENIGYVLTLEKRKKKEIHKQVLAMLDLVGLDKSILNRYPDELSGGQAQRVNIARSYVNKPEILLMDEPFGQVDSITRYNLQEDLIKMHQTTKCSIVFITHDIHEAFKLATKIVVIDKGEVKQIGTKQELIEHPKTKFVEDLIKHANI